MKKPSYNLNIKQIINFDFCDFSVNTQDVLKKTPKDGYFHYVAMTLLPLN